ncbi:DUF6233 domain-containing protein [Streptomyces sp. NPDC003032]
MNDKLPVSRLDLLRFLRRVQMRDLARTDEWIAQEEQHEAERLRGEQARPPAPDWLIEKGLNGRAAVYAHRGDCHMAGKRSKGATREQVWRELAAGRVEACPHCRPDTELGVE